MPPSTIYEYSLAGAPKTADTIEELAAEIGVPSETLRNSIDKYNSYVEAGADPDFGRTTLVGISGKPVKIETPPFSAVVTKPGIVSTKGGLKVDADCQVIDVFGQIVRGLFAPGEILGGFHGGGYHTGTQFGKALTFGRIVGKLAASETPWE